MRCINKELLYKQTNTAPSSNISERTNKRELENIAEQTNGRSQRTLPETKCNPNASVHDYDYVRTIVSVVCMS